MTVRIRGTRRQQAGPHLLPARPRLLPRAKKKKKVEAGSSSDEYNAHASVSSEHREQENEDASSEEGDIKPLKGEKRVTSTGAKKTTPPRSRKLPRRKLPRRCRRARSPVTTTTTTKRRRKPNRNRTGSSNSTQDPPLRVRSLLRSLSFVPSQSFSTPPLSIKGESYSPESTSN